MVLGRKHSPAAYTLIDMNDLDKETRQAILEDAAAGGGQYGVRVVEEVINGGGRAPIFGVYNDGPDADRWAEAKKDLGISSSEVDDSTVVSSAEVGDARREAALREAAAQQANAEADRLRAGEDAAVAAIDHSTNIVDSTLVAEDSDDADAAKEEAETASRPTRRNRAPR